MTEHCDYCSEVFSSEDKLDTHILLHHREEAAADGYEFKSPVSDGHMKQREVEKGEQFGYNKRT